MSYKQSLEMAVGIGYRCSDPTHPHYTRSTVEVMEWRGDLEWVGQHFRVACYPEHRTWAKKWSGPVSVMQLVPGAPRR